MKERIGKRVRLMKLFERLEEILFHEKDSSLALQLLRADLNEIMRSISLKPETRQGLETILALTKAYPIDRKSGETLVRTLTELRKHLESDVAQKAER